MTEGGRRPSRVPVDFFEDLYATDPDPWGFDSSAYEQRKYDLTMASLPRQRYRGAFEPGCAFGTLTARLAARCATVLAADAVRSVVERARDALAGEPHVRVEHLSVPEDWPPGTFDLVVLSELAYYFTEPELDALLVRSLASLETGGDLVAVHWTGATSYPLAGGDVALRIDAMDGFERLVTHVEADFELGCWRKR